MTETITLDYGVDIDEIPLPELDEYPAPHLLDENADEYLVLRSHDNVAVQLIAGATRLVNKLLKNTPRTADNPDGLLKAQRSLTPKVAGDLIYYLAQIELLDIESLLIGHRVNPYLVLLLDAGELLEPGAARLAHSLGGSVSPALMEQLRDVVAQIRTRASSPEWQTRVESILRRCRDNDASMREYVRAIYTHRASRNLVIRLDLGYTRDHAGVMSRPLSISEEQAKEDFDRFIRYVREHYPLTGWVRRLEYGIYSGLHFHVLIFLRGREVWGDSHIAQVLGEYWRWKVTEGQGRFYNCNRAFYRWRGIGLIDRSDHVKLGHLLEHAGRYLTKSDLWVEGDSAGKSFVRGQMPTEPIATGRPRSASEGG
jgi:hypothetical protein